MTYEQRYTLAALTTLVLLQAIMLTALYAGIRPHPPVSTPLFGMAPFIGASVSLACAALIVGPEEDRVGRVLSMLAAITALVSFGPQKYADPQIGLIWPAVILGQVSAVVILFRVLRVIRARGTGSASQSARSL